MADLFGLDFGTTTTLVSRIASGEHGPVERDYLEEDGRPHASAIVYHGDEVVLCRQALASLDAGDGGVSGVRSPKSKLGTGARPSLGGVDRHPRELVAQVIRHAIEHARSQDPEFQFESAVATIPVDMGGRARRELREAARDAGIAIHQFVHEPLAALYAHLRRDGRLQARTAALGESPILVVDWGGGTLDLTLAKVVGNMLVQLDSRGEHRAGGDRFDEALRNAVLRRHAERHDLTTLQPREGASANLLLRAELAKVFLSDEESTQLFVPNFLPLDGPSAHISEVITRQDLEEATRNFVDHAMAGIAAVLENARVDDRELGLVLLTGGMSGMPLIRQVLHRQFGIERVPDVADADRLVAHGAAWIAHDRRRLTLAKPFELTIADDLHDELVPAGTLLPVDEHLSDPRRFPVYCVDPREGHARFELTRPLDPGSPQSHDLRRPHAQLQLPVDALASPGAERLKLDVTIDSDLIVTVVATSDLTGKTTASEIHDLEFGLSLEDVG